MNARQWTVYKWKGEIEWTTPDEIAYNAYTRFEFDKEASGIYSDETVVTILNSMYYSVLLKIEETQPEAMSLIEPALPSIFGENDGMFTKVKVKDYLFEGLKFCENEGKSSGFAAVMFCKQVIGKLSESKNLRLENKTVLFANLYYVLNNDCGFTDLFDRVTTIRSSIFKISYELQHLCQNTLHPYKCLLARKIQVFNF
ncbi:unnamed protein product [Diabrotica balteata]|uniref:Uncharacterized protein n=1 Tax=Diabrotica balteata TaxID=107213 RepID=A0A9N9TE59_DIABA|nr:unnamed protein product [Diabrotica balteata]